LACVQFEGTLVYVSTNVITSVTNERLTTPACVLDSNLVFSYDDTEILVPRQKALSCNLTHLYKKSGPVFDHKKKKAWRNRRTCSLEIVHSVWIVIYSWCISRLLRNFTIKSCQILYCLVNNELAVV